MFREIALSESDKATANLMLLISLIVHLEGVGALPASARSNMLQNAIDQIPRFPFDEPHKVRLLIDTMDARLGQRPADNS